MTCAPGWVSSVRPRERTPALPDTPTLLEQGIGGSHRREVVLEVAHDVARVVWSDIARAPRATVLPPDDPTVPLNTCYTLLAPHLVDALAFSALLNAAPVGAWLSAIAEPARGGYHRFMAWTIARLPVPADWPRARDILAPIAMAAMAGSPPDARTLALAAADAYRVRLSRLVPLMDWCDHST